ncbi:hypothetical protein BJ875DRAFT_215115 [Amylocarpus encephaloides]|uniref:Uncharacterized protein n=1 Tax=Amylocarpus encephaloides TaxID=45428 RepID=A0A9P8C8Z3_9HELO|nr:hypothetical protein BJ875DRAFT_215115 [Amylocarpus encephaloides]
MSSSFYESTSSVLRRPVDKGAIRSTHCLEAGFHEAFGDCDSDFLHTLPLRMLLSSYPLILLSSYPVVLSSCILPLFLFSPLLLLSSSSARTAVVTLVPAKSSLHDQMSFELAFPRFAGGCMQPLERHGLMLVALDWVKCSVDDLLAHRSSS